MAERVYLDWNATAPLRDEARQAMIVAMDVVGNPSSVHAEGRAAKGLIERARGQVAALAGCDPQDIVFCSSATEAAQMWFAGRSDVSAAAVEHDAVGAQITALGGAEVPVDHDGQVVWPKDKPLAALQVANSETGVIQSAFRRRPVDLVDATQALGKIPFNFSEAWAQAAICSGHKFGGPKGAAALILGKGVEIAPSLGGGQEMGRRSGTENLIGIAGFGAAAEASARDLAEGRWDEIEKLRKILEKALAESVKETIFVGNSGARLPNTSCFITPGWKGETQVMQMDLAGFAVSAGSACSSGKVRASRVLTAMGYSTDEAASALRVSLGPETTEDQVYRFAEAWSKAYKRHAARR
ncbi:cysteine desulfurase family protein [Halocynthiibacter sp. C4]|uniref:cysteine desulfurase family protein n=1 Tax=Halocynthiibacter sp. C4 TaxID=2992758 RepID=UPI00237B61F7|nr:cysteine desulfurase family protein [Halocynthiibacter sp. C4]MDE0589511.1 cysteine desulfurase family protein [Halocynthiibacter sp. C4]